MANPPDKERFEKYLEDVETFRKNFEAFGKRWEARQARGLTPAEQTQMFLELYYWKMLWERLKERAREFGWNPPKQGAGK